MNAIIFRIEQRARLFLLLLLVNAFKSGAAEPGAAPVSFRFAPVSKSSLELFEGEKPVLVYNHGEISGAGAARAQNHSCYIHPLYGLDGEVLTGDFPADHAYHRGVYWAWPHIKIDGAEYDLWSLRGIRPEFLRWIEQQADAKGAFLAVENGWFVNGKKVMREEVRLRVHHAEHDSRAIDVELTWMPVSEGITLWGAPGKSYGGFTFRFAPRSRTIVTVPSGRAKEDLLMARLPWADFTGDFHAKELSGAAVFLDPKHPGYPVEWMTREYGMLAAGYPGVTARTFPADERITCKYRIWIHRGNPEAAAIQKAYEAFSGEIAKGPANLNRK